MNASRATYRGSIGSICPACRKGILEIAASIGGEPSILECSLCKNRFYKLSDGELVELGQKEKD